MKVCPVCGEVYRPDAARCLAHDVRLRAWREPTTDTQLGVVTDVELSAAPPDEVVGLAETPRAETPGEGRAPAPVRGRMLGGRYRLGRQLGVGGYGAVFAAEDLLTHDRVAIKVLTPAASQCAELVTRFHREAIAASRARHPHIVDIADFDVDDDGGHYIVMERLDGRDLAAAIEEAIEDGGRLAPARALVIAAQCARGLAAAHRVGVLHRDLKPANVFLVQRPDGGESVKIIDFGISKLTRAAGDYTDVTSSSKVVGTPAYMAPEQACGNPLDARADVYALGVMLFEMLVGERPFTGRSPIEILTRHLRAPRVPPSASRPELAACPGLDALVLRALAAAPDARFRTMEELGDAILACLRAIDPEAAEHATEITGELTATEDAAAAGAAARARRAWRGLGLGLAAIAVTVTLAVTTWGGEDDGPAVPAAATEREPAPAAAPAAPAPGAVATAAGAARDPGVTPGPSADAGPEPVPPAEVAREPVAEVAADAGAAPARPDAGRRAAPARATSRVLPARRPPRPAPSGAAALGVEEW